MLESCRRWQLIRDGIKKVSEKNISMDSGKKLEITNDTKRKNRRKKTN